MDALTAVDVGTLDLDRLVEILPEAEQRRVLNGAAHGRKLFAGRRIWNVNSTARGGGVAEMLTTLLAYARGLGVDARWLVLGGEPDFFRVTKRLHNRLHGFAGDGGPLGAEERAVYERTLEAPGRELRTLLDARDVLILHDPQTAGLIPHVVGAGVPVVWRCHVGLDTPNDFARGAWDFLRPYVLQADAYVFSRRAFAWSDLDDERIIVIAPSIDALAPKNQDLAPSVGEAILAAAGIRSGGADGVAPEFVRLDGTTGTVRRRATVLEERPLAPGERYVLQVSRWDRLKDPLGVIGGFAEHVAAGTDAHLIYAGPDVTAVSDDPEGAEVLAEARALWHALPDDVRARVHLALLPMEDADENAAMVNALQREAAVVVQKSLAEGFGLTVAEAMWKARPVVASRIGGIQDQVEDGRSGVLLDDPRDLGGYGRAVRALLEDRERAERLGAAARDRVRIGFLGTRSLLDYLAVFDARL